MSIQKTEGSAAPVSTGSVTNRILEFLASPGFVVTVAALTVLAHVLALEVVLYTLFAAVAVFVCLRGEDLLPLVPLVVCSYIAPAPENNPGRSETSVFYPGHGGIWVICLGGAIVLAVVFFVWKHRARFFRRKYRLLWGFLALAGAYLLSGLGSKGYTAVAGKNLLFALCQALALLVPYLLICGGVDWKSTNTEYFAWTGVCTGGVLMCQILWGYLRLGVVVDGVIRREMLYTGWGMYNNMGGMLAMMIPFAFSLADRYRRGWLGTVVGSVFLVGVLLSCSRGSLLVGSLAYVGSFVALLLSGRNRKEHTITVIAVAAVILLVCIRYWQELYRLFSGVLEKGLDPSDRDVIYREGLALFRQAPVFGTSFYSPGYEPWEWSQVAGFTDFFPPRWHNTWVQLLACCGLVGAAAYGFHRVQTLLLFRKNPGPEKIFIGLSLAALAVASLLDCHFFNLGPGMVYAMALAFAENT